MDIEHMIFALFVVIVVVVGCFFVIGTQMQNPSTTDTYGNAFPETANKSAALVTSVTEGGMGAFVPIIIVVAAFVVLLIVAYVAAVAYDKKVR